MSKSVLNIIKSKADFYGLDPYLIYAIILKESNEIANELRLENGFYRKYVRKLQVSGKIDPIEAICRSSSWGLMQIMGQTARELGFQGNFPELFEAEKNIELGCLLLRRLYARYDDMERILLAYNGGGNSFYPDVVKKIYEKLRERKIFEEGI